MQCQICQTNEATIHLTEINQGQRDETHLCEQCAAQEGISVNSQQPINELLSNLLGAQPAKGDMFANKDPGKECPQCGFTLENFRKDPLLGCPHDYELFEKSLMPLIEKAHQSNTTHCGKVPAKTPADTKKNIQMMTLQEKLQQAVQKEDYETAAQLRDEIEEIK